MSPTTTYLIILARPLRLVYYDMKGNFRVYLEAISTLQHVKGNLSVIYVYGCEFQGNIFIWNYWNYNQQQYTYKARDIENYTKKPRKGKIYITS